MHKRPFFTSDMACKTPSSKERRTKSRRLPRLPATLRRIESAAPLKTCGGHGSEDELREPGMLPGSTPQQPWHRLPKQPQRLQTQPQCCDGNLGNVANEYSPAQATQIHQGLAMVLDSTTRLELCRGVHPSACNPAIAGDVAKEYSPATQQSMAI